MLSLLLLLVVADAPEYHIQDPELFQIMRTDEVHVTPSGEVYVLNFSASRIQHYGADGNLKTQIGGRGKGPGEFTFPILFRVIEEHIYIQDELTQLVSIFKMDGTYVSQVRLPGRNLILDRGTKGWFFWERTDTMNPGTSSLQWAGADFKEPRALSAISTTGWEAGVNARSNSQGRKITYSPLSVSPSLAVSPDGARCYYTDALLFKVEVYDGHTGKHLHSITSKDKPIPFDTEWADARFLTATEVDRRRNPGVTIKKLYPEYFPAIRKLYFDPAGNLIVDRWRGRPDKKHYLQAYDKKGKEIPLGTSYKSLRRNMGVADGMAYIMMYEEDEDAGLVKVPVAEVEQFIKDHPITDWSFSRSISISN